MCASWGNILVVRDSVNMYKYVEYHIGPRNCGKSERAELSVQRFEERIYFGTIENNEKNYELIKRHIKRRDDKWALIETSTELLVDISRLEVALRKVNANAVCMIDGLTSWAYSTCKSRIQLMNHARVLSEEIIDLINIYYNIRWVLIDVTPDDFRREEKILSYVCDIIRGNICGFIHDVKIIKY
jgi:adenosyl cobinamide kinase/adenosyl cobinamide phosphate guanylyltransferase